MKLVLILKMNLELYLIYGIHNIVLIFQNLVPNDWCNAVDDSEEYLEESRSKLLGVGTHIAVPRPCNDIVRVDIVQGMVLSKTTAVMPDRCKYIHVLLLTTKNEKTKLNSSHWCVLYYKL